MSLSIAIPTYNRKDYLHKLLKSIPPNISVDISDNGSYIDDDFSAEFPNATFHPTREVLDVFENWNNAATKGQSDWIIIPSDDDLFFASAFTIIDESIKKHIDADIIIFGHNIIDEDGVKSSGWVPEKHMVFDKPFGFKIFKFGVNARMPSIIFKRRFLENIGFFDTKFKLTAGDSELIQRALILGKSAFIPEIISGYRVWAGGLTSKKIATKQWLDEIDYWQQKVYNLAIDKFKNTSDEKLISSLRDEVYARNLLEGLISIRKSNGGMRKNFAFINQNRYPWGARIKTQFFLIKTLILG